MGRPGEPAFDRRERRRRASRQERVMATAKEAKAKTAAQNSGRTGLAAEFADALRLVKSLLDPYRPELHYMRGPGPKWHAKHRRATAEAHQAPGLFHVEA
jgi:hypothetical protein